MRLQRSWRPKDLARCARCKRLCQKDTLVNVAGYRYGPECADRVQVVDTWHCGNCGKDRPIEAMATPDCCEACAGV